jgi:hypothetical protein
MQCFKKCNSYFATAVSYMTEIFMKLTTNGASLSVSRRSASHRNVRLGCENLQLKLLAKNNYTIGVEKRKIFKLSFQIEVQNFFIL